MRFYLFVFSLAIVFVACSSSKKYTSQRHRAKTSQRVSHNYAHHSNALSKPQGQRKAIINTALKYVGKPYRYGGTSPSGFDCSGFTQYIYNKNGVALNRPSHGQAKQGRNKKQHELEAGDLVFFGHGKKVTHVGIVLDNQAGLEVVHATSSRGVVVDNVSHSPYWQKRILYGRDVLN